MGKRERKRRLRIREGDGGSGPSALLPGHVTSLGRPSPDSGLAGLAAVKSAWRAHGDRGRAGKAALSLSGGGARGGEVSPSALAQTSSSG